MQGLPRSYLYAAGLLLLAGIALSLAEASSISPWLRVVVALLVFILPGGFLFVLAPPRESWDAIDFIGYGFAFSVALITVIGLITRTFSLSIDAVVFIWFALAILGFATVFAKAPKLPRVNLQLQGRVVAPFAIIFCQVLLFAYPSIYSASYHSDQFRHQAAVNGFLRDEPLGWSEPYYETGYPIADRMYFTYWVLAQALVVEISGVPILLARYFVNPFVVIISAAAFYVFARNLNHSRRTSLHYVSLGLFTFSLLTEFGNQTGSEFIIQSQLDKFVSAFALAPIAISSAWLYSNAGDRRACFCFALSFLAAVSVHSVLGGFAAVVIGFFCLIRILADRESMYRCLRCLLLLILLLAPSVLVRLNTLETTIYSFDELPTKTGNYIYVIDSANPVDSGNNLFAIHSDSAGALTYVLAALTIASVMARPRDARSLLMLAYVLTLGIGLLPLTAWIYSRLVSVFNIVRVLWLIPYGYMLGFAIETAFTLASQKLPVTWRRIRWLTGDRLHVAMLCALLLLTALFLQANAGVDYSRDLAVTTSSDHELIEIASLLDENHDDRVMIAASDEFRERIIAMHWKVISLSRYSAERMSYYSTMPIEEMREQRTDNLRLYKADVPVQEKLAIVDRYGLDYLLFPKGYAWMIDALYQMDKQRFELVYSGETLRLVRVHAKQI